MIKILFEKAADEKQVKVEVVEIKNYVDWLEEFYGGKRKEMWLQIFLEGLHLTRLSLSY